MSPEEHDYIGLSSTEASSSMESSVVISSSSSCEEEKGKNRNNSLNLKETELRLGLPGSESPDRNAETFLVKSFVVSGAKRGFSDAMIGRSGKVVHGDGKWGFSVPSVTEVDLSSGFLSPRGKASGVNDSQQQLSVQVSEISVPKEKPANDPGFAPASKSQVVGWPPVRSFRRNTMVTNQMKNGDEADVGCLYVKVSMDGAPYLRKIDLKTYGNYLQLSSALEKMFRCFTIGQCGSHGVPGRDGLSESRLMDFLHGSEYVLTYEDKDGDWMLVGDVPWEMFTDSCKRLRIMKGSEAIGLAPRAMEKCKNRN